MEVAIQFGATDSSTFAVAGSSAPQKRTEAGSFSTEPFVVYAESSGADKSPAESFVSGVIVCGVL